MLSPCLRSALFAFIILLGAHPAPAQSRAALDSLAQDRMASWMKPNGRHKRHNFQFHFRYGAHYRFDGALGQVSKRDITNPAGHRYKTASVAKTFVAVQEAVS